MLPNYDDIAFFETVALENRGGIYPEAVRNAFRKAESTAASLAAQETQSVMVVETAPPLGREDSMDDLKMPGHYSRSNAAFPVASTAAAVSEPILPNTLITADSPLTVPVEESAPTISENVQVQPPSPVADEGSSSRGRTEHNSDGGSLKQPRGTSVPASQGSTDNEADGGLDLPSRRSTGRSRTSSRSTRISHIASQFAEISSTPTQQQAAPLSAPSTFSMSAASIDSKVSNNTGSFLMNLKNRATAAANAAEASNPKAVAQARETVQKWGAQWASLKKNFAEARESRSGNASSPPASSTSPFNGPSPIAPIADVPTPPPPARTGSISRGFDDMRRVVAERKQREERERVVSDVGKATPLDAPLDRSKRRDSAGPVLLSSQEQGNATPSGQSSPVRMRRSDSIGNMEEGSSKFIQPPATKSVPTVVETLLDASPLSQERRLSDAAGGPKPNSSAITAQPTYGAMSMTIPGIHAKNRNEVMAIGFSPPTPPTAPVPVTKEDGVGVKIGNIYRLLNRNKDTSMSTKDAIGALNSVLAKQEEAQRSASPEAIAERSGSTRPSTPTATPGSDGRSRMSTPPPRRGSRDVPSRPSSPASEALKSLVAKDELARRNSLSRRRTGSLSEFPSRSRSASASSSSPLSASFSIPITSAPIEMEPASSH